LLRTCSFRMSLLLKREFVWVHRHCFDWPRDWASYSPRHCCSCLHPRGGGGRPCRVRHFDRCDGGVVDSVGFHLYVFAGRSVDLGHTRSTRRPEAGGALMVAGVQLSIMLGALLGGVVFDAFGPRVGILRRRWNTTDRGTARTREQCTS
jgi:hypothetical protein